MSRLALGLLAATLVHGALYVAGVAFLPAPSTPEEPPAKVDVEIDVNAATANPVAAATRAAVEGPTPRPARRTRPGALTAPGRAVPTLDHAPPEAPIAVDAPALAAPTPGPAAPPHAEPASPSRPATRPLDGALLSAKPRYRVNPAPEYPIASRRRREEGVVMVKVTVEANGAPSAISLAASSGYPLLDAAALDAVRRWTFDPARAAGVPVPSLVNVPVRFSLSEP
jgi:protein TonB